MMYPGFVAGFGGDGYVREEFTCLQGLAHERLFGDLYAVVPNHCEHIGLTILIAPERKLDARLRSIGEQTS